MTRIALITGANRGLGFEVARQLARSGVHVLVCARDHAAAVEAVALLRAEGLDADAFQLDVTDTDGARRLAAAVRSQYGRLDVLVNNAGILPEASSESPEVIDGQLFRQTFDTNVVGVATVTEHLLPLLRESPTGRIVNVSSTMGSLADQSDPSSPYYALVVPAYQASKAALNSVTIGLSKLLADTPIKVNSVCPGWVQTDLAPGNREQAPLTAAHAGRVVVRYALVGDEGPTGGFFDHEAAVGW